MSLNLFYVITPLATPASDPKNFTTPCSKSQEKNTHKNAQKSISRFVKNADKKSVDKHQKRSYNDTRKNERGTKK